MMVTGVCFFNDTATTEIYTLSLHDALPILELLAEGLTAQAIGHRLGISARTVQVHLRRTYRALGVHDRLLAVRGYDEAQDRKSTRLNSSHANISYAVFCLKKKHINSTSLDL